MNLNQLLAEVKARTQKSSPKFYWSFSPEESARLQEYYKSKIHVPLDGMKQTAIFHPEGAMIAWGYERIVVGDYGAYLEISPEDMILDNICQRWKGEPKRAVKYIWMQLRRLPRSGHNIKIYHQQATVRYADYKPGMYYVSVDDVQIGSSSKGIGR
ncbi:MAG: hypothetical protein ACXABY_21345 [Candidatus Thorarchaeota archaeon]